MMRGHEWGLRSSLTVLMVASTLITFSLVVAGLLVLRLPQLAQEVRDSLHQSANASVERIEDYLQAVELRLKVAGTALASSEADTAGILAAVISDDLSAFYILDGDGVILAARTSANDPRLGAELVGTDQSYNALVREAMDKRQTRWSDKFLSAFTGQVAVGVAIPLGNRLLVGELPLDTVLAAVKRMSGGLQIDTMVVDRRGELLADTTSGFGPRPASQWFRVPVGDPAGGAAALPEQLEIGGRHYYFGAHRSDQLGWLFVTRAPAGIEHPAFRDLLETVAWGLGSALLIALLAAPLWARQMARPVTQIAARLRQIATGALPDAWPSSPIAEYNALARGIEDTGRALHRREKELNELNEKLEGRVTERTAALSDANLRLSAAAERLRQTQASLVQSEKLAALGRLVAGIAHELNTPIGNGLMAATTLCEIGEEFRAKAESGLTRSDLRSFVADVDGAIDIITRNLNRAADLVASFKQVAVDQASAQRREFVLNEVIDEILLTLQPSLKRGEVRVEQDIEPGLRLDSFPGPLGQVLANLVINATIHGFDEGRRPGTVSIVARRRHGLELEITVSDDGAGMSEEIRPKIFDPFFTTRQGRGGTGLGLHIVHNAVSNVLGGSITVDSAPGRGSSFTLRLPMIAPERRGAEA